MMNESTYDPQAWVGLLFDFGPYGILALFLLWVLPRATRRMQELTADSPAPTRMASAGTLFASWAVVLTLVGYVVLQWPPERTYTGQLGRLHQSEFVYPISDNVYLRMDEIRGAPRIDWSFALTGNPQEIGAMEAAEFVYRWGDDEDAFMDFAIPTQQVVNGDLQRFPLHRLKDKEPGAVYQWSGDDWSVPSYRDVASAPWLELDFGWSAHADDKLADLAERLADPNRLVRAKARSAMRRLSDRELRELAKLARDDTAKSQVERERQRRHRN